MTHVEAVVINRNRKPTRKSIRKNKENFRIGESEYILDPDRAVFEKKRVWWKLGGKVDCIRYYYVSTHAKPVDFYNIQNNPKKQKEPKIQEESIQVSPGEMRQLFNPIFYQIIARLQKNVKQDITLYVVLAIAVIQIYFIWQIHKAVVMLERIMQAMGIGA